MKMKRLLLATTALLLVVSCSDQSTEMVGDAADSAITFIGSVSNSTRFSSSTDEFESGDEISVTAFDGSTIYANNVTYSHDGSSFYSTTPISQIDTDQKLSFIATFPTMESYSNEFTFEAMTDQSVGDNYEMSDLLISTLSETSALCPVLTFRHAMSKLSINISDSSKAGGVMTIYARSGVLIDIESDSYTTQGAGKIFTPITNGSTGYDVIFAPQTIYANEILATYEVNGTTYAWKANDVLNFESGNSYTFNWDLANNSVEYDGENDSWTNEVEEPEGLVLADLSATNYPAEDTWVITDYDANTVQFAPLIEALEAVAAADSTREISLEFPNLKKIPSFALLGQINVDDRQNAMMAINTNALVSIKADKVTTVEGYSLQFCDNLRYVELPSVTSIETYAFFYCGKLATLKIATAEGVALSSMSYLTFSWVSSTTTTISRTGIDVEVGSANSSLVDTSAKSLTIGGYTFVFNSIKVI